MTLTDRIVAAAYSVGWSLVKLLPEPLAAGLFRAIADVMWRRRGKSVLRLESNLARVTGRDKTDPYVRELARAGLRSYFRYWLEVFRLPAMDHRRITESTHVTDEHHIFDVLAAGRGIVIAIPHTGNWDAAGTWMIGRGHPLTTVAERLKPESLFERFLAFREGLGMEVLPLTAQGGGTAHAFGTLAKRLRQGKVVALPAERDLTATGVEVDFFGARARMVAGPALLAIQTGAALVPAVPLFVGKEWGLQVFEEISVPAEGTRQEKVAAMTQRMAHAFEKGIAERPEDWHMLQRLWLDDLDPR
ncbi:lipid A biosynthesis lauroyl acyltransferase [Acrocarpospora pleiomorpha]|uniref:Lipid A biosynthesis lauroyl acyltransferase n=1 Tax=Acrocarpospora pleiomorpha TaxID=90975 RepID=A0A5M3XNI3_9ACTN|nr:phosphatidylinositol mannoside acyltransferase [Acrocarpospora pleiomorpha]GES21679.1 lipid A biosynthesis lauroyl acyltransferase [Acrocarpospora pleiomorpha]